MIFIYFLRKDSPRTQRLVPLVAFKPEEQISKTVKSHIKRAITTIDQFNRLVHLNTTQMSPYQPLNHRSCQMLNKSTQQRLTTT
jgi:hypothetical protein